MKIFFDTEFTGLHKNTTLMSIGLIAENGEKFYAEFTDFDKSQMEDWIIENVYNNMYINSNKDTSEIKDFYYGSKCYISYYLRVWLSKFKEVELISDVCHYDMVLFIDIFGDAWDIPGSVSPCCYDINQDIAKYYGISQAEAFDKSREEILYEFGTYIEGDKHNALYDAMVIKEIYNKLSV